RNRAHRGGVALRRTAGGSRGLGALRVIRARGRRGAGLLSRNLSITHPVRRAPDDAGFSMRALRWLIAIAIVSFAARILVGAFGEDFTNPSTPNPSAFSYSALGHRALLELLESRGIAVFVRQDPHGAHGNAHTAELFLEPSLAAMRAQDTDLGELLSAA